MKKGIVVEVNKNMATVMQSGGSFTLVKAKKGWEKGDVVRIPEKKQTYFMAMRLAACLAVFLLTGGIFSFIYRTESAVISMDINPSIEISINRLGRVLAVTAMNDEAVPIVSEVTVQNQPYTQAVNEFIENKRMQEYLQTGRKITFSVAGTGDSEKIAEKLKVTAREGLRRHGCGDAVESLIVEHDDLEKAHHLGITAGKYVYLERLEAYKPEIDLEQYCHHSIEQIEREIDHCKNEGTGRKEEEKHRGEEHREEEIEEKEPGEEEIKEKERREEKIKGKEPGEEEIKGEEHRKEEIKGKGNKEEEHRESKDKESGHKGKHHASHR